MKVATRTQRQGFQQINLSMYRQNYFILNGSNNPDILVKSPVGDQEVNNITPTLIRADKRLNASIIDLATSP